MHVSTHSASRRSLQTASPSRRLAILLGVALVTVFALCGTATAATVSWYDFADEHGNGPTYAPGTYDRIGLRIEENQAPAGKMLVGLESRVTWRKGIELDRPVPQCTWLGGCYFRDVFFAGMYTQDNDKGPVYREVALADTKRYYNGRIGYGRLRFGKAGFGGIWHGNAYELRWDDAHIKDGRKYTFIWLKD